MISIPGSLIFDFDGENDTLRVTSGETKRNTKQLIAREIAHSESRAGKIFPLTTTATSTMTTSTFN